MYIAEVGTEPVKQSSCRGNYNTCKAGLGYEHVEDRGWSTVERGAGLVGVVADRRGMAERVDSGQLANTAKNIGRVI
jgi:hypothetical protein